MKALVYSSFGPPDVLEWTEWRAPEPLPRTVLVRTRAGSVNPKDALLRKGKFRRTLARDPLPRISGMDAAGVVVAGDPRIPEFKEGDPVFGMVNRFSGGAHAEIVRFRHTELWHAPASLTPEEAAAVPLAGQTALQALRDCCRLKPGQTVLINGASGGVGHLAVQIAKTMGAEVHGICGPANQTFVSRLGADRVYNYKDRPVPDLPGTYDAVFDVFGKLTRKAFSAVLRRTGIYVSTVPKPATLWGETLARTGISGKSRLVRVRSRSEDLARLKEWIDAGLVRPFLDKIYSADQAARAHAHIESRRTRGKIVLTLASPTSRREGA